MKGIGKTSYLANQVKENALQYIEDKFAQYIIGHGGWVSKNKLGFFVLKSSLLW